MEDNINDNENNVYYCRGCLSLAVINAGGCDYCKDCGSMDIAWAPFERWQWLYRNKYGQDFVDIPQKRKKQ